MNGEDAEGHPPQTRLHSATPANQGQVAREHSSFALAALSPEAPELRSTPLVSLCFCTPLRPWSR